MKRAVSLLGSILMVGGLALLVYVGYSYWHQQHVAAPTHGWSKTQQQKGKSLAHSITQRQVKIPKKLQKGPPSGSESATRIVIPKIGVDAPVVQTAPVNGVWEVADWAVGHLTTSPNPGGLGNAAYSAHDDIKGELFKRLNELGPGDAVMLYTPHAVYTYTVVKQLTVDPSDVAVLDPTPRATVTLISCVPYWVDTQRLVVQGVLKSRSVA